jgi:hypothetical protein
MNKNSPFKPRPYSYLKTPLFIIVSNELYSIMDEARTNKTYLIFTSDDFV